MKDDCAHCGSNTMTTFKAPNKKSYCADCMRIVYPPTISLLTFPGQAKPNIWNLNVGQYEQINNLTDLEMCGWEPRMFQKLPNGTIVVHMEFFGNIKCGRCMNYPWTLTGVRCLSKVCEDMIEFPNTQHPQFKSLWLAYKNGEIDA